MPTILLSNDPAQLATALGKYSRTATVEAEYGATTVHGSVATLAHHGVNAGNKCPCSYDNDFAGPVEAIGVSHIDLDTIGGIAALCGLKPEAPFFWALAEQIDLGGAHKIGAFGASDADIERMNAYWAWNEAHKVYPPRDGAVLDVTVEVLIAIEAVSAILDGDVALLQAGRDFAAANVALERESYRRSMNIVTSKALRRVVLRQSAKFVNHLYAGAEGIADAVVGFNPEMGSVTVSFAEAGVGDACAIVQKLWGPLAGGHKGIAGSPRGRVMTVDDATEAFNEVLCRMDRP